MTWATRWSTGAVEPTHAHDVAACAVGAPAGAMAKTEPRNSAMAVDSERTRMTGGLLVGGRWTSFRGVSAQLLVRTGFARVTDSSNAERRSRPRDCQRVLIRGVRERTRGVDGASQSS